MDMKLWVRGPCGAIVHCIITIRGVGEASGGSGSGESRGRGTVGRVWLRGIAGAEVLAHLLKSKSAFGDVGGAETTSSIALYEALGEEKVCNAFPPDLDVLLGLEGTKSNEWAGQSTREWIGLLGATLDGGQRNRDNGYGVCCRCCKYRRRCGLHHISRNGYNRMVSAGWRAGSQAGRPRHAKQAMGLRG